MQSTPLCGLKIVAILESTFVLSAVPIYRAARLMGIPLGGSPITSVPTIKVDIARMGAA
jgi:hypothetical protein